MALTVTCHIVTMANGSNGAWAAVVFDGDRLYPFRETERTHSLERLELVAMAQVMEADLQANITFHLKNKQLVGAYHALLPIWLTNGWVKSGQPVPNQDLWERIVKLRDGREVDLLFAEDEHRFFDKCTELATASLREVEQHKNTPVNDRKEVMQMAQSNLPAVTIWTDGVCYGNPGAGGWSAILVAANGFEMPISDGESSTTNQRMDIIPVIRGLEALNKKCRVRVMTESAYVLNCFKHNWRAGWEKRDWKDTQGKPVPNKELWQRIFELVDQHEVVFIPFDQHNGAVTGAKCVSMAKAAVPKAA